MNTRDLDSLERDVEEARKRLARDAARLLSAETLTEFKQEVLSHAEHSKDELVHKAREVAVDGATRLLTNIKARALANPTAALAIGAGLTWRLAQHPPIASLLVAFGVASLLRTNPSDANGMVSRATELAETVSNKVQTWSGEATEAAREAVSQVSNAATDVASRASKLADGALAQADARDAYLLGAAALAIGAATVIAYQRRAF
jgi:hypothetical protein